MIPVFSCQTIWPVFPVGSNTFDKPVCSGTSSWTDPVYLIYSISAYVIRLHFFPQVPLHSPSSAGHFVSDNFTSAGRMEFNRYSLKACTGKRITSSPGWRLKANCCKRALGALFLVRLVYLAGALSYASSRVLIMLDRLTSSLIGRPCAMHDEECVWSFARSHVLTVGTSFDADLPVECDDEYWECADPGQNWNQPPGKPSKISAFNTHLRLCEILSFALRTLYSTKKSKLLTGLIGNQWEQHVVAELDSAMNNWKDSLLDHCASAGRRLTFWIIYHDSSAVESSSREYHIPTPICLASYNVLLHPNPNPPTIHPESVSTLVSVPCHMHQRS